MSNFTVRKAVAASLLVGAATVGFAGTAVADDYPAPTPSTEPATTPPTTPTSPGTPVPTQANAPMPVTGGNMTGLAFAGGGLVIAGGALIAAKRRTARD